MIGGVGDQPENLECCGADKVLARFAEDDAVRGFPALNGQARLSDRQHNRSPVGKGELKVFLGLDAHLLAQDGVRQHGVSRARIDQRVDPSNRPAVPVAHADGAANMPISQSEIVSLPQL